MKRLVIHSLVLIAALEARAQELQFSQPEQLGTVINSDDEELAPMLSPDGQTLYFSRAFHSENIGGKYAGTDIWISRKDANGNWTPAVNAGKPWNNKRSNAVIGISADGSTVYLLNAYNNKSGISFSKSVNGIWTKPEFIPVPGINRDDFVSIYVHPSFDVMLISMKGKASYGEEDLYISLKDSLGSWNQPRNLGPTINTSGFEISPFLTFDKRRLYFASNGHPGLGDADIFYSDRLYDSWETWTSPKNLGEKVNSMKFDFGFTIFEDSLSFFSTNIESYRGNISIAAVRLINIDGVRFRLLSGLETESLLGKGVTLNLNFTADNINLTAAQRELIWFVTGKVLTIKNVKILVSYCHDGNDETLDKRLTSVIAQFALAGLEGSRIEKSVNCSISKNVIEIALIE